MVPLLKIYHLKLLIGLLQQQTLFVVLSLTTTLQAGVLPMVVVKNFGLDTVVIIRLTLEVEGMVYRVVISLSTKFLAQVFIKVITVPLVILSMDQGTQRVILALVMENGFLKKLKLLQIYLTTRYQQTILPGGLMMIVAFGTQQKDRRYQPRLKELQCC